jgi:hypothetical protein
MHESCDLYGGGAYCQCSDAEKSHGPDCSTTALSSGGNCVLGEKGCTCGHYSCSSDTSSSLGGCSCSFHGDDSGTAKCDIQRSGDQGRCCIHREDSGFTCECKDYLSSCYTTSGEYPVASCNVEDVLPMLSMVLVSKCSN